jgi:hypothetical protein
MTARLFLWQSKDDPELFYGPGGARYTLGGDDWPGHLGDKLFLMVFDDWQPNGEAPGARVFSLPRENGRQRY